MTVLLNTKATAVYLPTSLRRESHTCRLKTSISRRLTLASLFLTSDCKMWVVAILLDKTSKNMLINSDPCTERKPCVKWINDNTFLTISGFWSEKHWEWAHVYNNTRPKTSEDFGLLRESSEMIVSSSKISALPADKNLILISRKKLAGIPLYGWHQFLCNRLQFFSIRNYYQTLHAKGPQDGAEANLKHKAGMAVIKGSEIIQNGHDLFNYAFKTAWYTVFKRNWRTLVGIVGQCCFRLRKNAT